MAAPYRGSKPSRLTLLLGLALVPLLAFFVVMEVHWLGQLSDAQRTETRRTLTSAVERLAGDLQATLADIERRVLESEGDLDPEQLPLVSEIVHLSPQEEPSISAASFVAITATGQRFEVQLDVDRIASELCPVLIQRALGPDALASYRIAIVPLPASGSETERPALYRSDPNAPPLPGPADAEFDLQLVPNRWFDLLGGSWTEAPSPVFIAEAGDGELGPSRAHPTLWRIEIRHRAGSLERAFENARRRNLTLGGGLLALLVLGLATLWIAEQRARRLLERELAFVAGVSHELRTPLAVLRTAASNLERGTIADPSRIQEYGALMSRAAERLSTQVERVLRFGADGGSMGEPRETFTVRDWIDEAIRRCEPWRDRKPFEFDVHVESGVPALFAEREALVAALHNLLENAIKYGIPPEPIRIEARLAQELIVQVQNSAEVLSSSERARLFEPFYRGRQARREQRPGTGLGLGVAREIVERHAGRLELLPPAAHNGIAHTIRFELRLPLPTDPSEASA